ncbi:MAG TPA: hypothetical protein VJ808_05915 [Gemmatimonadales bacterium]|nr:hypothetical protein [Gemmatimonadales bacterium]
MTQCELLAERIPAVMLGRSEWTAEERQHLDACPACRQECEIVGAAARLGKDVAEKLDLDGVVITLHQRLRRSRQVDLLRRRALSIGGLAAAAAVAVALWTGNPNRQNSAAPVAGSLAAGQWAIPLPELQSLQPAELDSLLRTMDEPNVRNAAVQDPDLRDLNSEELERVLDSWEG